MPTLVSNPSSGLLTLPFPFRGVLKPGAGVVLDLTEAQIITAMGANAASSFRFSHVPEPGGDAEALGEYAGLGSADLADGSVATADLANGAVTAAKLGAAAVESAKIAAGAVGTAALADGGVTAAKMADGASIAALLAAGLGAGALVDHADVSPKTILAADADDDRAVLVVAVCTETLAGDDAPTFNFGWDADPDGLLDELIVAGATAGQVFVGAGVLPATKALIATLATGGSTTNDAGAFSVTVLALPVAP